MIVTDGLDAPPLSNVAAPDEPGQRSRPGKKRVVTAPRVREISTVDAGKAHGHLPAPHRRPATAPLPAIATVDDLRLLVGLRDPRDPVVAAIDWLDQLGIAIDARPAGRIDGATITDVIAWGERHSRLADRMAVAMPGDLLVFERTDSDAALDLVAIVIARDPRGVMEMVYVAGGVVRRGFVDPARPSTKRDDKAMVVNSFLRHGRRWPPAGTRYLAGELLAHVIHTR